MNLTSLLSGPLPARAAAVAGAVGAVAITVLYLVRLRRRRVVVSFAPLWLDAAGPRRTTAWARRLRDLLSLLLALVLLGLSLLAAVDPRPAAADRAGRSLVVLIDRSASMSARDAPGRGRGSTPPARAPPRSSTGWARRIGRWSRRSPPTPWPRPGSRRTRGACAARWRRSRPARSRAICRAR